VTDTLRLDIEGLRVDVGGDWPEVVEGVGLDFAWFRTNGDRPPAVDVDVRRAPPDFDAFGDLTASFITPRNVVYQDGGRTIVDYFGRAVSEYDRRARRLVVQGDDVHLVHEAVYHFVLSALGEHLDARGLPRLHSLGLAGSQGGVAVMLPSGGGKSTLALRALGADGVKLLSEDTPLIDRHGRLHPFPLRIGVNATDAALLPAENVRTIVRMEFHPKLALELSAFADEIADGPVPLRHLVIGRRTLGRTAALEPVGKHAAAGPLLRELLVGVGVYQGMEFVLQHGMRDVARKARPALTRARCCAAALSSAQVWRLTVGRDHERNWEALRPLL
jgi:hypothetical protein